MRSASPCFACPPSAAVHDPEGCVRTLCPEHRRRAQTLSGASLPEVLREIEGPSPVASLDGSPAQWLLGPIRVRSDDGADRTGWCVFVPAFLLVAEDRFGASSWFDFWITDLSLDAADFRRPALDTLARSAPDGSPGFLDLALWALKVGGSEGLELVSAAWTVWAGEERVARRRASTGRLWPRADELRDWLGAPVEPTQAEPSELEAFTTALARSLRRRAGHLGGRAP